MEKRRPHYSLSEIQNMVLLRGLDAFTKTAIDNADAMGLSDTQMIQAVLDMTKNCFYKSMTTHASSKVWQDVYHPITIKGVAYVKVTLRNDGAVVIQFKEK